LNPTLATRQRDPAVTSRMMAAVRSKNTTAELALRRELHRRGIRFRLHGGDVTGRPDLVWRGRRIAVFVDGDMWHGNSAAWKARGLSSLEGMFPNRTQWWVAKLRRTQARDAEVNAVLGREGWVVIRVWESEVLADVGAVADRVLSAFHRTDIRARGLDRNR
jgi:DNA mismatch endonuclease (patch repair protein)